MIVRNYTPSRASANERVRTYAVADEHRKVGAGFWGSVWKGLKRAGKFVYKNVGKPVLKAGVDVGKGALKTLVASTPLGQISIVKNVADKAIDWAGDKAKGAIGSGVKVIVPSKKGKVYIPLSRMIRAL